MCVGIRVFAVVTGMDKVDETMKQEKWEDVKQKVTQTLRIDENRVYNVRNFTSQDIKQDHTLRENRQQRESILRALYGILNPSHMPDWKREERETLIV